MTSPPNSDLPDDRSRLQFPPEAAARLQFLLDRQDTGEPLTDAERAEADVLVKTAELLTLVRLRRERGDQ
jgi:hypothetical protein